MKTIIIEHKDRFKFYDLVANTILDVNKSDKCIVNVNTYFDELSENNTAIIVYRE